MNPYKTIRLSKSVLSDIKALQKDGESIPDTIRRLYIDYSDCIEEITYRYSPGFPATHNEEVGSPPDMV